jgi:GNAT superfamily N-acetyltransferase
MPQIEYSRATANDYLMVTDMRKEFAHELAGPQPPDKEAIIRTSQETYFRRELDANYICWYATVDGVVASIAGIVIRTQPGSIKNPSGIWGYLMNVYTRPAYRRMGLSRQIIKKLIDSAGANGITAFELHATPNGELLYQQEGFTLHKEPTYRMFTDSLR